ncbi:Nitrogen permease regulator 3 [Tieghemiomyces parasiticus]|uniref:Nitrogen permease regulator 3 n=1 Tax=Tieghemiomyces parasiticus TaxID=78921 RepID=A0A9W8DZ46_9FUNG|nr:Nitrogen permease regulator 3 [Tieghemiomyces parasiticus]
MRELLAIFLISESSRERQVVFRYPLDPLRQRPYPRGGCLSSLPHPTAAVRPRPTGYILSANQINRNDHEEVPPVPVGAYRFHDAARGLQYNSPDGLGDAEGHGTAVPPTEATRRLSLDGWGRDAALGLSNRVVLTFIARKSAGCDHRFQLTVDDLLFVGQPFAVRREGPSDSPKAPRPARRWPARPPAASPGHHGHDAATPRPDPSAFDYDSSDEELSALSDLPARHQVSTFYLLFVLDHAAPAAEAKADLLYRHVADKLCTVLRYAQRTEGYVADQTIRLNRLLDRAFREGSTRADWMQRAMAESSLARTLARVYDGIVDGQEVRLAVAERFPLALQVPPRLNEDLWRAMTDDELHERLAAYPFIQPQQVLLPLHPPQDLLTQLPPDVSVTMAQVVHALPQGLALGDLHSVVDCSLAQMYRLAAHLIYWRKAKVVNAPEAYCEYIVSPRADLTRLREYNYEFSARFPKINLLEFLASFSMAKSLQRHIQSCDAEDREAYFNALIFLLTHDLVTELNTYVYAATPSALKPVFPWDENTFSTEYRPAAAVAEGGTPTLPDPPSGGSGSKSTRPQTLEQWTAEIDERHPHRKIRFNDLFKYLDGKHTAYEIHYLLQMPLRDLRLTLKMYRSHLITIKHMTG